MALFTGLLLAILSGIAITVALLGGSAGWVFARQEPLRRETRDVILASHHHQIHLAEEIKANLTAIRNLRGNLSISVTNLIEDHKNQSSTHLPPGFHTIYQDVSPPLLQIGLRSIRHGDCTEGFEEGHLGLLHQKPPLRL